MPSGGWSRRLSFGFGGHRNGPADTRWTTRSVNAHLIFATRCRPGASGPPRGARVFHRACGRRGRPLWNTPRCLWSWTCTNPQVRKITVASPWARLRAPDLTPYQGGTGFREEVWDGHELDDFISHRTAGEGGSTYTGRVADLPVGVAPVAHRLETSPFPGRTPDEGPQMRSAGPQPRLAAPVRAPCDQSTLRAAPLSALCANLAKIFNAAET